MYHERTKQLTLNCIQQAGEITANKLQYLNQPKKRIHNKTLLNILIALQKDGLITINEHQMNGRTYRVIKHINM